MYCTGGVRCEKAAAWFATDPSVAPREIGVLEGGVVAYAEAFGRDSCVSGEQLRFAVRRRDAAGASADDASRGILDGRVGASSASVSESVSIESVSESVDPGNDEKARRSSVPRSNFVFDTRGRRSRHRGRHGLVDTARRRVRPRRAVRGAGVPRHPVDLRAVRPRPAGVFCCARCEAQEGGGARRGARASRRRRRRRERRLTARAERRTDEATRRRPPRREKERAMLVWEHPRGSFSRTFYDIVLPLHTKKTRARLNRDTLRGGRRARMFSAPLSPHPVIMVPAPSSVRISSRSECGALPSMMCADGLTPCAMDFTQHSTGIIPPAMTSRRPPAPSCGDARAR